MIKSLLIRVKDRLDGKAPAGAVPRSPLWPAVRKAWLRDHGTCAGCGGTAKLEVHHVEPFHVRPEKELDSTNFVTLCEAGNYGVNCHLALGHRGNYINVNPDAREDAAAWGERLRAMGNPPAAGDDGEAA